MADIPDPFRSDRRATGVRAFVAGDERMPMILRHGELREAAKDWQTFSSDAPFRVPIPSEEHLRSVRQLPIETDPPDHSDYRTLVEPFFLRARQPEFVARVEAITAELLKQAVASESVEVVSEFALPLQSRALTVLLGVPQQEAERFIAWGVHVFHGEHGLRQARELEAYLGAEFDRAAADPGDDFYGVLTKARFRGRPLSREEKLGFANLMFAGGRDTVIHSVATAVGYLAEHPEAFAFLREDPGRIVHAAEEFFRAFMPLTHISRTCPVETDVHGTTVPAGGRVSLCWASANLDETVFEAADEVRLDRRPNPHVSFGFGAHLCLGAAHARTVLKAVLKQLCEQVGSLQLVSKHERVETTESFQRQLGYETLNVAFAARR
ncbi:cytochrome P450 [bacterium]|jgi:cytochrome P450|nr:cytochrome P450 [Pirellulales bacterium]NBP79453.1 cytochrome P450 [bacterium]